MGAVRTAPRPFLTVKEVMILLGCKEDFAYKTMRKINKECCAYSGSTQPYQKRMPVLLLQRQSEKPAFADGSARPRTGKGSMTGNVQTEKKITIQKWRK